MSALPDFGEEYRKIAHQMRVEAGKLEDSDLGKSEDPKLEDSLSSVKRPLPPDLPQEEGEKLLTFDTPVTFSPGLDWYWDKQYSPPFQIPGSTTLMGPSTNEESGAYNECPITKRATMLVFVAERLRENGYDVQSDIGDGHEEEDEIESKTNNGYKDTIDSDYDNEEDDGGDLAVTHVYKRPKTTNREKFPLSRQGKREFEHFMKDTEIEYADLKIFSSNNDKTTEKSNVTAEGLLCTDGNVARGGLLCTDDHAPWLVIESYNEETTTNLYSIFRGYFCFVNLPHTKECIPIIPSSIPQRNFSNEINLQNYRLEVVNGSISMSPSTLFNLYYKNDTNNNNDDNGKVSEGNNIQKRDNDDGIKSTRTGKWADYYKNEIPSDYKLIGKALCDYDHRLTEPDSVGPIIQVFEVANEWQNTGLGSALMRSMHEYFCDKFIFPLLFAADGGYENITLTINDTDEAMKWFMKRHRFRYGRGQDLVKPLTSDDYEHEHLFEKEASAYEEYEQKRCAEGINWLQRIGELNRQERERKLAS